MPATLAKGAMRLAISGALEPALLRLVDTALHEGLSRATGRAPDGAMSDESEEQLERLAHTIVEEILDEALTGPSAAELGAHGEHVVAAAWHRDGAAAQSETSAALSTLAEIVGRVLRDHRKDLVGVATRVVTRATIDVTADDVTADEVDIGTKAATTQREPDGEDDHAPVADAEDDEGSDAALSGQDRAQVEGSGKKSGRKIRHQLSETGETLMRQLSVETDKLQERLKGEMGSAVKKGTQNQKLGRAPTGGHPSAGHSMPRGPSQGAPGTRRRK